MKTLVLSPHADDSEFFAGGVLYQAAIRGFETKVVVFGASPIMMSSGQRVSSEQRLAEAKAASEILHYELAVHRIADENNYLAGSYPTYVHYIELELDKFTPDLVIIPLPTYNQDHRRVYEAAMTALRPNRGFQGTIWAGEYPMQGWGQGRQHEGEFTGRVYVKLSPLAMDKKIEALNCHKSQMAGRESLISGGAGAIKLAQLRGLECNHDYAEMFVPLREIRQC